MEITRRQLLLSVAAAGLAHPAVRDGVQDVYAPAPPRDQQIAGMLGDRMKTNVEKRLLAVDVDVLLAGYRQRPGKQTWIGEHAAKFIGRPLKGWRTRRRRVGDTGARRDERAGAGRRQGGYSDSCKR